MVELAHAHRRRLVMPKKNRPPDPREPLISDMSPEVPVTSDSRVTGGSPPSDEEIRAKAYERYLDRGRGDGQAEDDWLAAEQELRERRR
jgi:hypothetical protein